MKENAELLDKLNLQNQRLNELKKENEELAELAEIQHKILMDRLVEIKRLNE